MTSDKWIAVRHDNRTDLSARRAVVGVKERGSAAMYLIL